MSEHSGAVKGFRVIQNKADKSADMYVYDEIGPSWAGMVGAKGVMLALKDMGDVSTINVHINSPGGSVWEGLGIYNALKNHGAQISVHIDGMAFSAASFIAMAGDEINMAENASMMIHEASNIVWGNAKDLRKEADVLDQINEQITGTYASRTGMDSKLISKMLSDETWMTAVEAKANGFATNITPNKAVSASFDPQKFAKFPDKCPDWAKASMLGVTNRVIDPDKDLTNMNTKSTEQVLPTANATQSSSIAEVVATELASSSLATAPSGVVVNVNQPASATPAVQVDAAEIEKTATAKERTRISEITATCVLAGDPKAAQEFIEKGTSAQDVKNRMFEVLCSQRPPVGVNVAPGATNSGTIPDANARYEAMYAENKKMADQLGISKERWILTAKEADAKK